MYQMALQYHQQDKGPAAIQQMLQALQANPQNPIYYDGLAELLRHYCLFQPAWCRNLGHFYQQQGQLTQALEWYSQGQQLQPENPVWLRYRGVVAYEQGCLEQALICFKTAQAQGMKDPELWYNLGTLSFLTEQFRNSWLSFLQVYGLQTGQTFPSFATTAPNHPLGHFHDYLLSCALFYLLNGQHETALALLRQIGQENPPHEVLAALMAML